MKAVSTLTKTCCTGDSFLTDRADGIGHSNVGFGCRSDLLRRWDDWNGVHKGTIPARVYQKVQWDIQDNILGAWSSDIHRHLCTHQRECGCIVSDMCGYNLRAGLSIQKADHLIECSVRIPHIGKTI